MQHTNTICAVIIGPSEEDVRLQIQKASFHADMLELRWDCFDSLDFVIKTTLPTIFTLRSKKQGGKYSKDEFSRLQDLSLLLEQKPEFVDIEHDVRASFLIHLKHRFPTTKTILSYHDFDKTPQDLNSLLDRLLQIPADYYKMATMANSSLDALRLLKFVKNAKKNIIALCMGKLGMPTRILNHFTYACLEEKQSSSTGQIPLEHLIYRYHFKAITEKTKIFALIGQPVDKSPSHITHNNVFKSLNEDAVYIKMDVEKDELELFFEEIKTLNFKGLSVTMPLKQGVIPFLNDIELQAKQISAVNTIDINDGHLAGYNTDCKGALLALEGKVHITNKQVVIFGAGGASRAIIYQAKLQGAHVTILNRTFETAFQLAKEFDCKVGALNDLQKINYDILINTTSDGTLIHPDYIRKGSVVMDITHTPKWTKFLLDAKQKDCTIIFGFEMFVNQAALQFELWLQDKAPFHSIKSLIRLKEEEEEEA
jgi:3-dehydroquinate dehydratase/shikimate dehydrogenase